MWDRCTSHKFPILLLLVVIVVLLSIVVNIHTSGTATSAVHLLASDGEKAAKMVNVLRRDEHMIVANSTLHFFDKDRAGVNVDVEALAQQRSHLGQDSVPERVVRMTNVAAGAPLQVVHPKKHVLRAGLTASSLSSGQVRAGYPDVDVSRFGAVGDGRSDSTNAFRSAIQEVKRAGGGTIRIPAGIFRSAPLELTSHMTLYLERGAVLKAIDDFALYRVVGPLESYGFGREGSKRGRRIAFLYGEGLRDVVITGDGGCIDGSGQKWWKAKWGGGKFDGITLPHLVEIMHTDGFELSNLRLINSPMWTVHPFACKGTVVKNVEIENPVHVHNTDGIDPDSCEDVLIEDVVYTGGDDGIALKSGWDCYGDDRGFNRPTRNVVIRNFTVRDTRAAAVAIGSEMSGGIANVLIQGLRVERAGAGGALCVKTTAARGGYVHSITVRDLQVGQITGAEGQVAGVMIAGRLGGWTPEPNPACRKEQRIPDISGVVIDGVRQLPGTAIRGAALRLEGLREGQVLRNVILSNVQMVSATSTHVLCSNAEVALKGTVSVSHRPVSAQTVDALDGWRRSADCKVKWS